MSLKNIGNILKAGTDFTKLKDVVIGIGDITAAAKALNKTNLSNEFKRGLLQQLPNVDDAAAKLALGITEVGNSATKSQSGVKSLGLAFTGLKDTFLSFLATPAGAILAIGAGLVAVVGVVDLLTESLDEAQEKAANSFTEYSSTRSEIKRALYRVHNVMNSIECFYSKLN